MKPHDGVYQQLARIGRALASAPRLALLDLLRQSPRTVDALAREAGLTLANASQHLKVLHQARLVEAEKRYLAPDRRSLRYEWGETVPSLVHAQEPLPDFEARLLEGGAFRTRDLRGRTLVLDSWSTTCVPCVVELPELNRIVAELASDSIEFVAVAPEEEATVREFLSHRPFRYRQAVTDPDQGTVLGQAFPRHVVVDGEGIVVFDQVGYESGGLDAMRAAILKAQPVPGKERTR